MKEEADESEIKLSVEDVLIHIGEFGLFQKLLDTVFCILCIPVGYQIIIMCFLTLSPPWICLRNSTICTFNETFPSDDRRRCDMPRSEWMYTERRDYSIVTQFDIYCDKEWILHLNSSILFAGWGIGAFVLGWVEDRFGRRIVLFPSLVIIIVVGFYSSFSPNVLVLIASRFVIGFFIPGTQYCMFLIISELVGSKQRPIAGLVIWMTLPFAFSLLALKAYFIRSWKLLSMICTGPYILLFAFYKFIPDSFQWQLVYNKIDSAMHTIKRIARWNGKTLPKNFSIIAPQGILAHQSNPFNIFTLTPEMALKSLRLSFIWFVIGMVYYGVYFAADDLGGSFHRDLFILSISEVPSSILAIDFCERFGRKPSTLFPLLIGSIACISIALAPSIGRHSIQCVVLGMIGKLFVAISCSAITTWTVEIFPVKVRSSGIGFMQLSNRIGSTSAPWIAKGLRGINKKVPFVIMGVASLLAFFTGFWLPETKLVQSKTEMNEPNEIPDSTKDS